MTPPPAKPARVRWAKDLLALATVVAVSTMARTSLADHYVVPSGSMEPTVEQGDRIVVDKRAYGVHVPLAGYVWTGPSPAPGEVVVLTSPEDGRTLLKRVVAGPGDLVAVRGGRLVRNGEPVPISEHDGEAEALGGTVHAIRLDAGGGPDFGPVHVPDGHYLVLGDNRGNSHDGRAFGFVPRSAILGRAVAVYARGGALTWRSL